MFDSLLIANRGEIACRVIRTARRMGITTIAVYSDADAGAQHVLQADRAVHIGPSPARESYLVIDNIISSALACGAQAVHPGYGFLSENAEFAEACAAAGLVFVGPSAHAIRSMGSKIEAKRLVAAAGTAVVPGYNGDQQDDDALLQAAQETGFPLLVKASAGGGGKGMRLVSAEADFLSGLNAARREAKAAFGDDRVLLERYLHAPKHIEVQILADRTGRTLHLFERDCSVQRRHQKVIEEAPAPAIDAAARLAFGEAAINAARSVEYLGAGTVEFIAEGTDFYFMEMNTRLQVEHPVTEAITGLDLVEWQLRIAAGEELDFEQSALTLQGHSVEARIYAENPRRKFLPSAGDLLRLKFPANVRVDSGVAQGDTVSMHYDPMLAKLISHGRDRAEAISQLDAALAAVELAGIDHNVGYLRAVLGHEQFRRGDYTTHLADDCHAELITARDDTGVVCALLALQAAAAAPGPWCRADGFRLNLPGGYRQSFKRDKSLVNASAVTAVPAQASSEIAEVTIVRVAERGYEIRNLRRSGERLEFNIKGDEATAEISATVIRRDDSIYVIRDGDTERLLLEVMDAGQFDDQSAQGERLISPMPGQVLSVAVKAGDEVTTDQVLLVIEAMKMEHAIKAPHAGSVSAVHFAVGDRVEEGVELVTLAETGS